MAEVTRTILQVNGVWIPDPSSLQWGIQSVSDSNAGRTTDGKMHVNLITRKRKLELSWNGVDFDTASEILKAVNPETFNVTYLDALTNTRLTKTFYVGDRTAPVHSYTDGYRWYTNVSFNIIEV
jgi:hypothetical protein